MEKACRSCGQIKSSSDFYAHKQMADGLLNYCKECIKDRVRSRRYDPKFREKVLAYDRSRGNRQSKEYRSEYRKRFPNKYRAHNLVNNAIRDKRLFAEPCEICGGKAHAHHDDYAKPLNVRWLCAEHHRQWHAKHGESLNP